MTMNTTVFSGSNPTQLYMDALNKLILTGKECSPRGLRIKELRPVILEYLNPASRVTFLRGRTINPFFQLAEALWIIAGRSDVAFLTQYNKNMASFSDDGVYFNAPYGERLRYWNKNDASATIINPIDQLVDVYRKIKADPDTRQAVASIYNPLFDNFNNQTKDRPCNMMLSFKLRDGKLDLQVFNRSNDIHWGTFGANLCQFATILEVMASWLGVKMGVLYQNTDSLHVYLDDYGYKETEKIFNAYGITEEDMFSPNVQEFITKTEPRITSSLEDTSMILNHYFSVLNPVVEQDATYESQETLETLLSAIAGCPDDYFRMTFMVMVAYQAHKRKKLPLVVASLSSVPDCSWKISCLRFLHDKVCNEQGNTYGEMEDFKSLYNHLSANIISYIEQKEE